MNFHPSEAESEWKGLSSPQGGHANCRALAVLSGSLQRRVGGYKWALGPLTLMAVAPRKRDTGGCLQLHAITAHSKKPVQKGQEQHLLTRFQPLSAHPTPPENG